MFKQIGLLAAAALVGCAADIVGTTAWLESEKPSVAKIASFDLGCPAESLQILALGANTKKTGVRGCGKHTTYLYVFEQGAWTRDSEVLRD